MGRVIGIKLDEEAHVPLYQQLVDEFAKRIRSGVLPAGYRLPPTRVLAKQLNVHRNTVVRAFEELSSLGFVSAKVGRGTFVCEGKSWGGEPEPESHPLWGNWDIQPLPWEAIFSRSANSHYLSRSRRVTEVGRGSWIDLASMSPPRELLPVEHFRLCVDHVLRSRSGRALGYAPREGVLSLREEIAADLANKGIPVSAEDVMITTGSQQGLDLVARSLMDPGDTFLLQSVTYSGILNIVSACGGRSVGVPADEEGPSMKVLKRMGQNRPKGMYLMPNVCNPTGLCISAERREELLDWSHAYGVPLIEDDYASDLELDGQEPPPALRALDAQVIYMGTFSKKLIPALRLGFLICPEPMKERILPLKRATDLGTSVLMQYVLSEFLDRGYLRAHLRALIPALRERRDALEEALTQHMPSEIKWNHAVRGPLLWLSLPAHIPPELAFEEARKQGVLVGPSSLYEAGATPGERGVRLVFCHEPPERLYEAGKRLGQAFSRLLLDWREPKDELRPSLDGA